MRLGSQIQCNLCSCLWKALCVTAPLFVTVWNAKKCRNHSDLLRYICDTHGCTKSTIFPFLSKMVFYDNQQFLTWAALSTSLYMSITWFTHAMNHHYSSVFPPAKMIPSYVIALLWLSEPNSGSARSYQSGVGVSRMVSHKPGWKTSSFRVDWMSPSSTALSHYPGRS